MSKIIFCKKYKENLEGLDEAPYPGPKGLEIYETVSKKAWNEWLENQKMLINENQLNLQDRDSRNWLKEQMELFFSGEDYARPKGYTPPKS
tara:strand:+ start:268 stop:540 length:273 start_codon:yes stop_codon:yes gene_type:complete